jgi:hypothetical protein
VVVGRHIVGKQAQAGVAVASGHVASTWS